MGILFPAGGEDPERPEAEPRLQARLGALPARLLIERVEHRLEDSRDLAELALLRDLRAQDIDHGWLWEMGGEGADALLPPEFLLAARMRIGAPVFLDAGPCARCGENRGLSGAHAVCCAPGEATRGHNRTRDVLLGLASLADGSARPEVAGLVPGAPALRPADILTDAAFGRLSALDVSIVAPHASGAGRDAVATRVQGKMQFYAPYLDALAEAGVAYRPLVWSAWGRPHEDAATAITTMAAAAGRRSGAPPAILAARARTCVGVTIWRQAARMVAACGPRLATSDVGALVPTAVRFF